MTTTTGRPLASALVLLALLAGCAAGAPGPGTPSSAPGQASATIPAPPSATPTPSDTATPSATPTQAEVPDIPVTSSSLRDRFPAERPPRPVAVGVPRLGARVDVEPVGVADDGQMEIPAYAETAGWYRFGAAPGDPRGTVVVAAHVDSIASGGVGPFTALRDAEPGDEVEVTLADGTTTAYVVTEVERRGKEGIDWEEVFVRDGDPRLVLITCGGRFLRDVGHYEDNLLVWAEPRDARR